MKTNLRARKVLKLRHRVILLAFLLLVSAEFWVACRLGKACAQNTAQPAMPVPAMGELFAAR
jgi:hypothetical protein